MWVQILEEILEKKWTAFYHRVVKAEQFVAAVKEHENAFIGLSALLTTTMVNMEKITKAIKDAVPEAKVAVGGAPVTEDFRAKIGADADLQSAINSSSEVFNFLSNILGIAATILKSNVK